MSGIAGSRDDRRGRATARGAEGQQDRQQERTEETGSETAQGERSAVLAVALEGKGALCRMCEERSRYGGNRTLVRSDKVYQGEMQILKTENV
eukprot:756121-Hanusia_phi.AAC.1